MPVVIYTQEKCAPCNMVKQYFNRLGVDYKEVPREGNEDKMLELGGKITTPLVVSEKGMAYGFNPMQLSELI